MVFVQCHILEVIKYGNLNDKSHQCKQFETFIPSGELQAGHLIAHASGSAYQIYSVFRVLMVLECLNWLCMSDKKGKVTLEQALKAKRGSTDIALALDVGEWSVPHPAEIHSYY